MSEYWKSVPRKFCDFCKCWITDNKPSVEFHERGKRHQENVELRLKEVRKKSLQTSMEEDQMNREMEKMEKAALEAFKKDLKDNPELAAQYGVSLEAKPQTKKSDTTDKDSPSPSTTSDTEEKKPEKVKVKEWFEAVTPEGYHYYWSMVTGESRWEAPDEYLSIEEQEATKKKAEKNADSTSDTAAATTSTTDEANSAGDSSEAQTEKADERKLGTRVDPNHSRAAYGAWEVVKEVESPTVYDETSTPPALDDIPMPGDASGKSNPKPQRPKFKEKTVTSLGPPSGGAVQFKKRKIAAGARNVRQKDNDD